MNIAVASGKGGTGKTTIAVNMALSLGDVQLLDCDVEEPNANIFLNAKMEKSEDVTVMIPEIDKERCDYCGRCSDFCMYNALAVVPSKVLVFPELCHSCGGCQLVCPRDAVSYQERVIGRIEHGHAKGLDFYHGILDVGEAMVLPVIKALKKKVDNNKRVILDAPPGTSCPVIETIRGSDYCILVTEPTPFGLHDLKLAVEVVKHLYLPFGVIINCDGIGDKKVELYCRNEKIPVLMKIPYSKEIAQLYSKGIPFVNELSVWREEFIKLFKQIQEEIER